MTLSDYQKWLSDYSGDDWDFLQTQLRKIVQATYDEGVEPDYMLFGGDFSCLDSADLSGTGMTQVISILQEAWPNLTADKSIMIQGKHDPAATEGLNETGAYYFRDFIIYVLNEDDFPTKQGSADVLPGIRQVADDLQEWLEERAEKNETRPIFIASHTGLHYDIDRTDGNNQYAYVIFDAINEVSKQLDVVFLFGHNHTNGDEQVSGSLTFFPVGEKLNVCTENSIANRSGSPSTLNFTYMNYGYVGYIGDITNNSSDYKPTDILTISQLSIYNDKIQVDRYSENGYEEDYYCEINRKHANPKVQEPKKYEVYYEARGGEVSVVSEEICEGSYIINRMAPKRNGYVFAGYKDDEGKLYQPGDEILVQQDVTLKAIWEPVPEGQQYVLTDTLKPGKKYILVWNSEITGNSGIKYALTTDGESVTVTVLEEELFIEDGEKILIPEDSKDAFYVWDAIWNQGTNPAQGYIFQNVGTKGFLSNANTALSVGTDPLGTELSDVSNSTEFKNYAWTYRDYNGYNQLAMYNDTTGYIRYSVGGGNVKLGTTSTSTDVNNSNVFLYELCEPADYVWELVENVESNEEYLIVSSNTKGEAKALTVAEKVFGEAAVAIEEDEQGVAYIAHEAAYNNIAVWHPYGLSDGTFWLDAWNAPTVSHTERLDESEISITSSHGDDRYYFRFAYDDGELVAYKGLTGTDTRTLVYNNGFTVGTGDGVYFYKRVSKESTVTDDISQAVSELKQKLEEAKLAAQKYNYPQLNTAIASANELLVRTDVTETEVYDSISALRKAIKAAKATQEAVVPENTDKDKTLEKEDQKQEKPKQEEQKKETISKDEIFNVKGLNYIVTDYTQDSKTVMVTIQNKKIGKIKKNVFKKTAKNLKIMKK